MTKTKCAYCGKIINKNPSTIERYKLHFCDKQEYLQYRKKNSYYINPDFSAFRKIRKMAQMRKELHGLEKY